MVLTIPSVKTERLILREFQPADVDCLHLIYQHEGVLQYFPNPDPPSKESISRWVDSQQAHWAEHACGNWAIVQQADSQVIGWAGLQFLPELDEVETGFLLDRPFWGKGYATEAAQASIRFGFELGLTQIVALVHPQNLGSQRVLEKSGMQYDRSLQLWGLDLMHYRIYKSLPVSQHSETDRQAQL